MRGLPWIKLHTNLPSHPKSIQLAIELGSDLAWAHMAQLWMWAAEHAPAGTFPQSMAPVVERAAGWRGDRGAFVDAAVAAGFIDRDGDKLSIHDWADFADAHIEQRRKAAIRQQRHRESRERDELVTRDVTRDGNAAVTEVTRPRVRVRVENKKEASSSSSVAEQTPAPVADFSRRLADLLCFTGTWGKSKPESIRDLALELERLGVETALRVCHARALEVHKRDGKYPVLGYYASVLADAPDPPPKPRTVEDFPEEKLYPLMPLGPHAG